MAEHYYCKTCGSFLPLLVVAQRDEFCSTKCARQYYGHRRSRAMPRGDRLARDDDGSFKPIRVMPRSL